MPHSLSNRLAGETSPYLQQHKDNPVAWQPWDAAALDEARREDRPILLSIGYSACHWCHVMAHECFEDADVAALMNRLFVNIKVDREERPDLDHIYQAAQQLLSGRPGGWPLTMFLAPDGTPFFGGTYFPKTPRHGLPPFPLVCERVAQAYREQRADLARQNESLREALAATVPHEPAALNAAPIAAVRNALLADFDAAWGGFGGAPKFPRPADLAFLLRQGRDAERAALLTLSRMSEGGIHDQIGGGFCRYSVDARWEIPHFEKMLYDNGPLLALYAEAWRRTGDARPRQVAEATAGWLMREMQSPQGGFYASLDADSEGEEGRYYVWDRDEIRGLLTAAEWQAAVAHWGLDRPPNFENRWHLHVAAPLAGGDEPLIESARGKLLAARARRVAPGRDEKILAGWNALAVAGLLRAARILDRPEWQESARRALDFIRAHLWRDGRLLASWKDGRAELPAYLDDHAFLLAALLESLQSDFAVADLDWATRIADTLLDLFEDKASGGFYFTADDHEPLIHRPKPVFDGSTPAGNGVAAAALQRLGHLLGEPRYLDAARRTLESFAPYLSRPGCASLLEALAEALDPPALVLLSGPLREARDWRRRLAREWNGSAFVLPAGEALPAPLVRPGSDRVNAWVCRDVNCLAPIDDFGQLTKIILMES